jgi:signal transduction histidine kinase
MHRSIIFVLGLVAIVVAAIAMIVLICQPDTKDIPTFAALVAAPLAIAIGVAVIGQRIGLWRRFQHIGLAMFIVYAIGAGLILFTMLITTNLMFISPHDAQVAIVITIYATGVTLVFGNFVVNGLSEGIVKLTRAASEVQSGNLSAQADVRGNDELATLARTFNQMTAKLNRVREAELQLDRSRREWIAWVSHDLRTPLTSLRARTEALADGVVNQPDEIGAYLGAIRNDTNRLSRLVDDLSDLANIDAGGLKLDLVKVDLGDLVSDTVEGLSVIAREKGVALSGSVDSDVEPITISPQHIQRVLNNLVGNALSHTTNGDSIRIRISKFSTDGLRLAPHALKICIEDTGEGIAQHDLPHVFERFYRGEKSRKRNGASGMGLGLVIAKELVEAHSGKIGVESDINKGTTVWFSLPIRD